MFLAFMGVCSSLGTESNSTSESFGSATTEYTALSSATEPTSLVSQVEIVDWTWTKDPDFGTDGAIKWNVRVKNNSPKYLRNVRVDFTSFDASRKMISTRFTYVGPIPPGGTASDASFADLYGNEASAEVQIRDVNAEE